jgi:hypothetical protein
MLCRIRSMLCRTFLLDVTPFGPCYAVFGPCYAVLGRSYNEVGHVDFLGKLFIFFLGKRQPVLFVDSPAFFCSTGRSDADIGRSYTVPDSQTKNLGNRKLDSRGSISCLAGYVKILKRRRITNFKITCL